MAPEARPLAATRSASRRRGRRIGPNYPRPGAATPRGPREPVGLHRLGIGQHLHDAAAVEAAEGDGVGPRVRARHEAEAPEAAVVAVCLDARVVAVAPVHARLGLALGGLPLGRLPRWGLAPLAVARPAGLEDRFCQCRLALVGSRDPAGDRAVQRPRPCAPHGVDAQQNEDERREGERLIRGEQRLGEVDGERGDGEDRNLHQSREPRDQARRQKQAPAEVRQPDVVDEGE